MAQPGADMDDPGGRGQPGDPPVPPRLGAEPEAGRSCGRGDLRRPVRSRRLHQQHRRPVRHPLADDQQPGRPARGGRAEDPDRGKFASGPARRRQPGHTRRRPDGRAEPPGRPAEGRGRNPGAGRRRAPGRVPRARRHRRGGGPDRRPPGRAAAHQSRGRPARHRRLAAAHAGHDRPGGGRGPDRRDAGDLLPGPPRGAHQHHSRPRGRDPAAAPARPAHRLLPVSPSPCCSPPAWPPAARGARCWPP